MRENQPSQSDKSADRARAFLARQLFLSEEALAAYPFTFEPLLTAEGRTIGIVVRWSDQYPPGVTTTNGTTELSLNYSDEIDWPDDL